MGGGKSEPTDEDRVLTLLESLVRAISATNVTKEYVMNALLKLSTRFSAASLEYPLL